MDIILNPSPPLYKNRPSEEKVRLEFFFFVGVGWGGEGSLSNVESGERDWAKEGGRELNHGGGLWEMREIWVRIYC